MPARRRDRGQHVHGDRRARTCPTARRSAACAGCTPARRSSSPAATPRPTPTRSRGPRASTSSSATQDKLPAARDPRRPARRRGAAARRRRASASRPSRARAVRGALARVAGRSRAFVKVQDGCQHRCAFCIVPARAGAEPQPEPAVVRRAGARLVAAGHGEVTLTGVDLGHYGGDLVPRSTLAALLRRLVARCRAPLAAALLGAARLLHAGAVRRDDELPVVAPHLHVPLQSGSDRVLRLMRRPYNARMYRDLVERLAGAIPRSRPRHRRDRGPSRARRDADFAATLDLVRALPFSYLHVFSYSDRAQAPRRRDCPAASIRRP